MERCQVGGISVGFRMAGSGPPLMILPGAMDDGRWWEQQVRDLSEDFTIVVWDAPGCGGSSDAPADWSLAHFADCVATLARRLALAPVHLLGLSFGGALAIEVVHRHPDVARSLLLVSAYAGWAGSLGAREARRRVELAERMHALSADEYVDSLLPTLITPATSDTDRMRIEQLLRDTRTGSAAVLARSLEIDLRPVLPTIGIPTLVVHGADDARAPRAVADELTNRIPGARMTFIEGAGHLVNIDAPDRLAAEIRAFLLRPSGT